MLDPLIDFFRNKEHLDSPDENAERRIMAHQIEAELNDMEMAFQMRQCSVYR